MKTDTYTKTVLTIIAVCLIILAAKSFDGGFLVSTAHAQSTGGTMMDVNISQIGGFDIKSASPYNNAALPVNIERVRGVELSAPVLPVKAKEN